ncbi:transposase [Oxynema sp. CENA135]|uniref:transposase n=1 Tax=Oxynema sp. CENA135 TaxID=984206 RepID=UPI00190CCF57|nr:transposase [Oxynema sp. CENA135]MBK4729018.1 transposase [Oxynema sp. CENA135]
MVPRKYDPHIHHRRSIRLKSYDYNQAGAYFITICVQNRECLLGQIAHQTLHLSEYGEIVRQVWNHLPYHFDNLDIDAAVIMPNHFHGILLLTSSLYIDTIAQPFYQQKTLLGKTIAYFKYQTTKLINHTRDSIGARFWQRNYYEHIIRGEQSLTLLRKYILENPFRWDVDVLHPNNPSKW